MKVTALIKLVGYLLVFRGRLASADMCPQISVTTEDGDDVQMHDDDVMEEDNEENEPFPVSRV